MGTHIGQALYDRVSATHSIVLQGATLGVCLLFGTFVAMQSDSPDG